MIVIYPMLTSNSVSPNVIPGIIKAVEKYVLLYNTNEVLKVANITAKGAGALKTGAELALVAGKYLSVKENEEIEEQFKGIKVGSKPSDDKSKPVPTPSFLKNRGSTPQPRLDMPRSESISLEPTWMQVTTKAKGLQILGVKVIPFRIKSADNAVKLLLDDKQLKFLTYLLKKYGRSATRVFFRVLRTLRIPGIKDLALTGNPKMDVTFAGTQYGQNLFLCFSQLELDQEKEFEKPYLVQRLNKLGWASFIITDDVNKRATFCMKEFGGICSVVPYGFIFSSLGREHAKVYEDLEELKKSGGPFFNRKTNRRMTFKESRSTKIVRQLEEIYNEYR